jgi:hypothetical protein
MADSDNFIITGNATAASNQYTGFGGSSFSPNQLIHYGRVISINLKDRSIAYEKIQNTLDVISINNPKKLVGIAYNFNPNFTRLPIINEIVLIIKGPNRNVGNLANQYDEISYYILGPISIQGNVNDNRVPQDTIPFKSSKTDYNKNYKVNDMGFVQGEKIIYRVLDLEDKIKNSELRLLWRLIRDPKNNELLNPYNYVKFASTEITSKIESIKKSNVIKDWNENKISHNLIKDIAIAAKRAGVIVTITTALTGHEGTTSRHYKGKAVDIYIIDEVMGENSKFFKPLADKFVKALVDLGYKKNREQSYSSDPKAVLWQTKGHYHHVHVSNVN